MVIIKKVTRKKEASTDESIIIDKQNNLIFSSEKDVLKYFAKPISKLESEFLKLRPTGDFNDEESLDKEDELEEVFRCPDQIWQDSQQIQGITFYNFIKEFRDSKSEDSYFYVAVTYLSEDVPTFVFLHFPTRSDQLCEHYRRGNLIYDRSKEEKPCGGLEGDALSLGDSLAKGLYKAMLTVRNPKDIEEGIFQNYSELRDQSIEEADEIWKKTTSEGFTLVTFIKDFSRVQEGVEPLFYLAVTLEEEDNSHSLLFSFPSNDDHLVDRYRQGKNLQAEEVIHESSH